LSKALEKATEQYEAGRYEKAVVTLDKVGRGAATPVEEALGLRDLATVLRDHTQGDLRERSEDHMRRANMIISRRESRETTQRGNELAAELRRAPVQLARWAFEAGLTWLELASPGSIAGRELESAIAAAASGGQAKPDLALLDAVEAEGWRLETVTHAFRPTSIQTSPLRGADWVAGGDVVEGDERCLYLFRWVDGASGGWAQPIAIGSSSGTNGREHARRGAS
jgi:hypothetical protein